ncbi:ferrous iron transport protein A [Tessaracoccus sp. HDW20]|nr:ferrous iron transport protein A [Tessaracoccus coleopterorum]
MERFAARRCTTAQALSLPTRTLDVLPAGEASAILGFDVDDLVTRRLFDLGFTPGEQVERLRRAPWVTPSCSASVASRSCCAARRPAASWSPHDPPAPRCGARTGAHRGAQGRAGRLTQRREDHALQRPDGPAGQDRQLSGRDRGPLRGLCRDGHRPGCRRGPPGHLLARPHQPR